MAEQAPLTPERLRTICPADVLDFDTTADLEPLVGTVGQSRAQEALEVGLGIRREGYNIFILGTSGVGKHTVARGALNLRARLAPTPPDWCYVHNFEDPHQPRALRLPAGSGSALREAMEKVVDDLGSLLPAVFTSDRYTDRARRAAETMEKVQNQAFEALQQAAADKGLLLVNTEEGVTLAPAKGGDIMPEEEFEALDEAAQGVFEQAIEELEEKLQAFVASVPRWRKETRERLRNLEQEVARDAVARVLEPLRKAWDEVPAVLAYFEAVHRDVVDRLYLFSDEEEDDDGPQRPRMPVDGHGPDSLKRYAVNVLIDHSRSRGAPVVYEDNPTLPHLVGRIEHVTEMGMLQTDHTLIKAGALHRASGGYLIIDAHRILTTPFSWSALKRALRARLLRMDMPSQQTSLVTTVTLVPEPIPVDVKVVLMGSPELYYELVEGDPEFERHFKILASFEDQIPRTPANTRLFARLIGTKARNEGLKSLTRGAVARVIEQSAREIEDAEHLSANLSRLFNLLDEADYWADQAGCEVIGGEHIDAAVDAFVRRSGRPRDELLKAIERETLNVATTGGAVGQINGLAVMGFGNFAFGRPSRITATARVGRGEVIDIEREAQLAGRVHSKGVLILESLLGSRYATDVPLSLTASLVFEQSYGMIDGDSASLAELCVLLSAIAQIPIRQSMAVTGSINQHGMVQAIGGVNEKIEGFFDICQVRGLTGDQGVVIPEANVKNLMLRQDVVDACREGRFHVYSVDRVEPALELLMGLPIGDRDASTGAYAEGTINGRVEAALRGFFNRRLEIARSIGTLQTLDS